MKSSKDAYSWNLFLWKLGDKIDLHKYIQTRYASPNRNASLLESLNNKQNFESIN